MSDVNVDPPPLDKAIVEPNTGHLTKAGREFFHRTWKRTGGNTDFIAGGQKVAASQQATQAQVDSLQKQVSALQAQISQITRGDLSNEITGLQNKVANLEARLSQVFARTASMDANQTDSVKYKNIINKPSAINAIDGLSPAKRRLIEYTGADSATLRALSGADPTVISGTAGTDGQLAEWNIDGDVVDTTTLTALTPANGSTVDATYGTEERDVIQNLVTRQNEIENRLKTKGII